MRDAKRSRQLLKTFNGIAVTYHSDYKYNPYVITDHGKKVEAYGDWVSCLYWLLQNEADLDYIRKLSKLHAEQAYLDGKHSED